DTVADQGCPQGHRPLLARVPERGAGSGSPQRFALRYAPASVRWVHLAAHQRSAVEMSGGAMKRAQELLPGLTDDVCVLTGDYRAATAGPFERALEGLAAVCALIKGPIYGVLGNHDTIRMVPGLEDIGIRMLLNECEVITRGEQRIYLAGIDDAHFFR